VHPGKNKAANEFMLAARNPKSVKAGDPLQLNQG
jgi:hypothetical protein